MNKITPEPTDPAGVSEMQVYYVAKSELTMHFGPAFDRTTTEAAKGISHRLAALRAPDPVLEGLFEAIQHGDAEHRAWLKEAIAAYAAGKPVPEPRGKGRKEAVLEVVKGALEEIASQLTSLETVEEDGFCGGDFIDGYDCCIMRARAALQTINERSNHEG